MKHADDIRRQLEQADLPRVIEGDHRQRLKERLEREARMMNERQTTRFHRIVFSRPMKIAAACALAAALVATGWAAEETYSKIRYTYATPGPKPKIALVSTTTGAAAPTCTVCVVGTAVSKFSSDEANLTPEQVQKQQAQAEAQLDQFIARKDYKLEKTEQDRDGQMIYVYRFPNGSTESVSLPLEGIASLAEYKAREAQQREDRQKAIYDAIAQGRYRLVDARPMLIHLCRENGQDIEVMDIHKRDGNEIALITSLPRQEPGRSEETSWQDHLEAIAGGRRELVNVRIITSWTYEVTLADGSKTRWQVGGDPLPKGMKVTTLPAQ